MWYEIIKWVSIGLCWVATAINIYAANKNFQSSRKLSDLRKMYIEELISLTKSEE